MGWRMTRSVSPIPSGRLDHYGGSVTKHLRHPLHDLGRVVSNPDYSVPPVLLGVLQHQLEGLCPGPLAEGDEPLDPPPEDGFELGSDETDDGSRSDRHSQYPTPRTWTIR